jgi:hypothetical protein
MKHAQKKTLPYRSAAELALGNNQVRHAQIFFKPVLVKPHRG